MLRHYVTGFVMDMCGCGETTVQNRPLKGNIRYFALCILTVLLDFRKPCEILSFITKVEMEIKKEYWLPVRKLNYIVVSL